MQLLMAQFAPIFCFLVFLGVWGMYFLVFSSLWWSGKRSYSF